MKEKAEEYLRSIYGERIPPDTSISTVAQHMADFIEKQKPDPVHCPDCSSELVPIEVYLCKTCQVMDLSLSNVARAN
jgi:hypothetical protein